MPGHELDRAIDGLARRQHGVFHLRQAVRLGATRAMRRSRLGSGRWIRLADSDVCALPSHPGTWLRQCMAATLSVPIAGVSGSAAAALHGFPGWRQGRVEVCTTRGTTHRSPFADVRETRTVGRLVVAEGIRVVSHADCLVQVAPLLDVPSMSQLVVEVGRDRRGVIDELRDRYVALAHSRLAGIGTLRAVLEELGDGVVPPTSALEVHLRDLLVRARVPNVRFEADAPWLAGGPQRVDALVPDWDLIVEADGRAWHTRVEDFEHDRWRDACALAAGLATLRFTWHQLTKRTAWCRTVLAAVGARCGSGGRPAAA